MALRIILLIVGVFIILGIAFDGWRRKRQRLQKNILHTAEPTIHSSDKKQGSVNIPQTNQAVTINPAAEENTVEQLSSPITKNAIQRPEKTTQKAPIPKSSPLEIETIQSRRSANQAVTQHTAAPPPGPIFSANEAIPTSKMVEPVPAKQEIKSESNIADAAEMITLTVMSTNSRPFAGYDLVKALEGNYLHQGEFDIYHRHKYKNGKGPLYFSVASVIKPGTLDRKNLGTLSTPGLVLFMRLNNRKHDRIVFKQMLSTAHQLAKLLGGVVCDAKRIPLREATLQAYAEKLDL